MSEKRLSDRPAQSYQDIISNDDTGAPAFLKPAGMPDMGTAPIAAERYWSKNFHDKEVKHIWSKVWQMACHSDDIPNVGDCFYYEIDERSLIIARTEKGVRAYHNSCLHRGRKLITGHCRRKTFVCPFHAITWDIEGTLIRNPIAWDMPQWTDENSHLPEAKIAIWGGFVFINLDPNAVDFEAWAAPMIKDLAPYDWDNRYRAFWYEKHLPANWKTVAEPFMESHHSQTTHPQLVPSIGDINSQYDFPNAYVSRQISAGATASPALDPQPTEFEKLALMKKRGDARVSGVDIDDLPENFRTRTLLGAHARKRLTNETGRDHSKASDAEVLDYILYGIFPHMTFWAGYGPKLVYRWRPEPGNPQGCIMDIMWMVPVPKGEPRSAPAQKIVLGYDDKISDFEPGSASLKTVFDQDFSNIPHIQSGMKSSASGELHFSQYTESRLRYMHQMIDRFIEAGETGKAIPAPDNL